MGWHHADVLVDGEVHRAAVKTIADRPVRIELPTAAARKGAVVELATERYAIVAVEPLEDRAAVTIAPIAGAPTASVPSSSRS